MHTFIDTSLQLHFKESEVDFTNSAISTSTIDVIGTVFLIHSHIANVKS